MNAKDFPFGFRVAGDCRQPRRLVDAGVAMSAYAACDSRCTLDGESYLSAFQFGDDFRKHLSATDSTAGFRGPCWAAWLWWDIDADGELQTAIDHARRLVVLVTDSLRVGESDVLAFFSGSKGFHLGMPTALWEPEPLADFHRIARQFAERVAGQAGATIDIGVYDKVRIFRAPNSTHPRTGLHKRRLSLDELMHLSTDAIRKRAESPEPFDLPVPTYRSEAAAKLWADAVEHVHREAEAKAERLAAGNSTARLNRSTLAYIQDGAGNGDRHRLLYSAASNLAESGAPLPLCVALLQESALDCGLPPKDVHRAIDNGWAFVQATVRQTREAVGGTVIDVRPGRTSDATPTTESTAKGGGA